MNRGNDGGDDFVAHTIKALWKLSRKKWGTGFVLRRRTTPALEKMQPQQPLKDALHPHFGVPGSGKTTFGNWLSKHRGFFHLDIETLKIDSRRFIASRRGTCGATRGGSPGLHSY
jgi:hypothetical protein